MLSGELTAEGDQLDLHMEYHANRYSGRFIDDFAARYNLVLEQMMRRENLSTQVKPGWTCSGSRFRHRRSIRP